MHRALYDAAGSTKKVKPTAFDGILSSDCTVNPEFCKWKKVHIKYCDGNSFSSNREDAVVVPNPTTENPDNKMSLYFRGDRIVQETLEALLHKDFGLSMATDVLIAGNSAGGLAALMQTPRIHDFLKAKAPQIKHIKTVPISGVFPDVANAEGDSIFLERMKGIYELSKPTYGYPNPNSKKTSHPCVVEHPENPYMCQFAEHHISTLTTPIFIANSVVDRWIAKCVVIAKKSPKQDPDTSDTVCNAIAEYVKCTDKFENCASHEQFAAVYSQLEKAMYATVTGNAENMFAESSETVQNILRQIISYRRPTSVSKLNEQSGYFMHTCNVHGEGFRNDINMITVKGVKMNAAIHDWYFEKQSVTNHRYRDCEFTKENPFQCNESCSTL